MIGSGDPTPYDFYLLGLLGVIALIFVAGAISGTSWAPGVALGLRRGGTIVAICALAAVMLLTPTRSGSVGAGRMITVFPAFVLAMIVFAVWSWRAGRI
ncbi:MAG: hypothetical protein H0X34_08255 [Chthoniobacterales bacterium]|nr:hypothetical protein [Gemmatimonadaceae bacterium]MBA3831870.1 hypothetical protein [Chthoniobacterales bacterium]